MHTVEEAAFEAAFSIFAPGVPRPGGAALKVRGAGEIYSVDLYRRSLYNLSMKNILSGSGAAGMKITIATLVLAIGLFFSAPPACAQDRPSPHGATEKSYGAKKPVKTLKEAETALREFFKGRDVEIGEIEEKELFFEAEIKDKKGRVIDRAVIDKRTGRIRSIY
jgi:hypothetical protein